MGTVRLIAGVALMTSLTSLAGPSKHVFSMSFKVTSLNGELLRPGMKERSAAWMKSHHISKVWLETYRHAEYVSTGRLVAYRDWFRTNGFEVCGLLTPTMLNDAAKPGEKPPFCCCWSDPKCRARLADESIRASGIFDTVLLDDFLFDTCTCPRCTKLMKESGKSLKDFRFDHMEDLCRKAIYEPARAAHPKSRFIIKFQCWFDQWPRTGVDPKRLTDVFNACWIGTESRDNCKDPLQSATITPWINGLTGNRCEGCWFDPLDSSPARYVQQARYTVLGGTRETLFHAYDYLIAEDPGTVPFGQSPKGGRECLKALEAEIDGLWQLAETVGTLPPLEQTLAANGVSRHLFRTGGTTYTAFQNTTKAAHTVPCPKNARVVLSLPDESAYDLKNAILKGNGFVLFSAPNVFD